MNDGELEPWERRSNETSIAYEAFRRYRDLGPSRTLPQVSGSAGSVRGWAAKHRWVERARAWDAETYRLDDARRLEAIREMDTTHRQVARALIAKGIEALRGASELTPHQAARMLDLGTRLERAALTGEHLTPVSPVESVDELSPLERIARELAGTA